MLLLYLNLKKNNNNSQIISLMSNCQIEFFVCGIVAVVVKDVKYFLKKINNLGERFKQNKTKKVDFI